MITETKTVWNNLLVQRERNLSLPLWKRWSLFLLLWSSLTLLGNFLICWTLFHKVV